MKRIVTLAGTLLLTAGLAQAQDVRPPNGGGADGGGLEGIEGGQIDLPEGVEVGERQMRTTMDDETDQDVEAVDEETVQDLRTIAIEDFGQSTESEPAEEGGPQEDLRSVEESRKAFMARLRERGVELPED